MFDVLTWLVAMPGRTGGVTPTAGKANEDLVAGSSQYFCNIHTATALRIVWNQTPDIFNVHTGTALRIVWNQTPDIFNVHTATALRIVWNHQTSLTSDITCVYSTEDCVKPKLGITCVYSTEDCVKPKLGILRRTRVCTALEIAWNQTPDIFNVHACTSLETVWSQNTELSNVRECTSLETVWNQDLNFDVHACTALEYYVKLKPRLLQTSMSVRFLILFSGDEIV